MTNRYFTDREHGPRPRDSETIAPALWATIVDLVDERMQDGALGLGFPYFCPDGHGCAGCDTQKLGRRVGAEIPDLPWPLDGSSAPDIGPMMDLLEFVAANVGQPIQGSFHSYFGHHHLDHERDAGLAQWRADLNRLFARNGVAFEMDEAGLMHRRAPEGLREALAVGRFDTSDATLDQLCESARSKFLSPKLEVRREALESLWDAYERLKTIDAPGDKKVGIARLLDRAAGGPRFRALLEAEARSLTDAGNALHIRHHEVGQEAVATSAEVDYLFHRLFALVQLFLAARRGP